MMNFIKEILIFLFCWGYLCSSNVVEAKYLPPFETLESGNTNLQYLPPLPPAANGYPHSLLTPPAFNEDLRYLLPPKETPPANNQVETKFYLPPSRDQNSGSSDQGHLYSLPFQAPINQVANNTSSNTYYLKEFYSFAGEDDNITLTNGGTYHEPNDHKNLRIVFIKPPENKEVEQVLHKLSAPTPPEKTAIYVFNKDYGSQNLWEKLENFKKKSEVKPEVNFVKYKTEEEANRLKENILKTYQMKHPGPIPFQFKDPAPVVDYPSSLNLPYAAYHGEQIKEPNLSQSSFESLSSSFAGNSFPNPANEPFKYTSHYQEPSFNTVQSHLEHNNLEQNYFPNIPENQDDFIYNNEIVDSGFEETLPPSISHTFHNEGIFSDPYRLHSPGEHFFNDDYLRSSGSVIRFEDNGRKVLPDDSLRHQGSFFKYNHFEDSKKNKFLSKSNERLRNGRKIRFPD